MDRDGQKKCRRCLRYKPTGEIYVNHRMRDGLGSYCKPCSGRASKEWRTNNSERLKAYLKGRRASGRTEELARIRRKNNPGCETKRRAAYMARHPEKYAAEKAVLSALARGALVRPTNCSRCGCHCRPHGHHVDYSKPLEVVWLCAVCHRVEHGKTR